MIHEPCVVDHADDGEAHVYALHVKYAQAEEYKRADKHAH
jgi:hypothetical protein